MNRKRIITIVAILVVIIIVILAIVLMNNKQKSDQLNVSTLPLGAQSSNQYPNTPEASNDTSPVVVTSKLIELSATPVAGATTYISSSTLIARYMNRADGHVMDVNMSTGEKTQVTNTTLPQIYEALWAGSKNVIMRYLNEKGEIVTYSGVIGTQPQSTSTSYQSFTGTFLPNGITSAATSPAGDRIFTINGEIGEGEGEISNINGTKSSIIADLGTNEWLSYWPKEGSIFISTKPSALYSGDAYTLNSKSGAMKNVLSGVKGLVINPNTTGTEIAYSDNNLNLHIFNTSTNSLINLPIQTSADKCVWIPKQEGMLVCGVPTVITKNQYPDAWYQGLTVFEDAIYQIDASSGSISLIGNLKDTYNQSIDILNPTISTDGNYLLFINKKDLSLWAFNLAL